MDQHPRAETHSTDRGDRRDTADRFDDEHYPAYTMGRAADPLNTTPGFLRGLDEAGLLRPKRSARGAPPLQPTPTTYRRAGARTGRSGHRDGRCLPHRRPGGRAGRGPPGQPTRTHPPTPADRPGPTGLAPSLPSPSDGRPCPPSGDPERGEGSDRARERGEAAVRSARLRQAPGLCAGRGGRRCGACVR